MVFQRENATHGEFLPSTPGAVFPVSSWLLIFINRTVRAGGGGGGVLQHWNHQEHGRKDLSVIGIGEKNHLFNHFLACEDAPLGMSSCVENKVACVAGGWKCLGQVVS